MDPIQCLPNVDLKPAGPISEQFINRGLHTLHEACLWTQQLTYARNSSYIDSMVLFQEMQGTCTSKHGAIARLAAELGLEIYKNLGFYRLNDTIVTGINEIISPYGLSFIPQTHCFLEYKTFRVDLTEGNCNGKNQTIEDYDFVVRVTPEISVEQEEQIYIEHLHRYFIFVPELQQLGACQILELLDQCNRQVKYRCSLMAV